MHEFDAETAHTGRHYYHAVLNTKQLQPITGEIAFTVNDHLIPPHIATEGN